MKYPISTNAQLITVSLTVLSLPMSRTHRSEYRSNESPDNVGPESGTGTGQADVRGEGTTDNVDFETVGKELPIKYRVALKVCLTFKQIYEELYREFQCKKDSVRDGMYFYQATPQTFH